ncbi:MAG: hypothetical protein NTY12_03540 [Candidatus Falkowbacteria bacterium]|nr:hypothetical protein [Candidatus Falkowbacteria bacterium]
MQTTNLTEKLVNSGLSKAEAEVYVILLSHPSMTINEIAKYSGLPRSTAVVAIEKLSKLGVIDEYVHGKRSNYVISSPKAIERYVEDQERTIVARKAQLNNLVTDIQKLHFLQSAKGAQVEILKGELGFKELYNRTLELKKGQEILRFGVEAEKFVFYPEFLRDYYKEKNKRGIKTRLLLPESKLGIEVSKNENKANRETRLLSKKLYNPDLTIVVWGEYVSFTTWNETLETVLIKSEENVNMMKALFEMLWLSAKK